MSCARHKWQPETPCPECGDELHAYQVRLDLFASACVTAAATLAVAAREHAVRVEGPHKAPLVTPRDVAALAYAMAHAMLEESERVSKVAS